MSDTQLNAFPRSKNEALAFLYVQNQDLSGKAPKEILDMYEAAYEEIYERSKERHKEKKAARRQDFFL